MTKRFVPFLLSTVALVFCLVLLDLTPAAAQNIVKVGNIMVTQQDVDNEVQTRLPMQVSFHGGIKPEKLAEIKEASLADVVDRAYKVNYAIAEEIPVDATELEKRWTEISERFAKAKNPEDPALQQLRTSMKASLYRELLATAAEKVAVEDKITVTEEDVKAYYAENKERFFRPKRFKASHIFVKISPNANDEELAAFEQRAKDLLKRAQSGEDFYNLAYYESDDRSRYVGGSLGYFHAGQTVKGFDDAIQKMKPGELAGPVRTLFGYHIIRLDELEEARQLEYDEVSEKIRNSLVEEQREALYGAWMADLKKKYPKETIEP